MKQLEKNGIIRQTSKFCRALLLAATTTAIAPFALAANFDVTADTPTSFRATFTGADTDPFSAGGGNDFEVVVFDFWTVVVNLRGDGIDLNGNALGFYEIQLIHSGTLVPNNLAPIVKTSLHYANLESGAVLTDIGVSSGLTGSGQELLTTALDITYIPGDGVVSFSGSIAGDSDLDGDGVLDSKNTDIVVDVIKGLMEEGLITGREMGQIIKDTRKTTR